MLMTPKPPYYAVIFSSHRTTHASDEYAKAAEEMFALGSQEPGYLGHESVRDAVGAGITVTYWDSLENIQKWKTNAEHLVIQKMGRDTFYEEYHVKIAKVEREYHWSKFHEDN